MVQLYRTSLQKKQGVQGAYALVWGGSSASNLLEFGDSVQSKPLRSHVKELHTPCYICNAVVRDGSSIYMSMNCS